jgi:hypothetical protein
MIPLLIALILSYAVDFIMLGRYWSHRKSIAPIAAFIGVFAASGVNFWNFNVLSLAIGFIAIYRFIVSLVVAQNRGHDSYIRSRALQSMKSFAVLHGILLTVWAVYQNVASLQLWHAAGKIGSVVVFGMGLTVLYSAVKAWRMTAYTAVEGHPRTKDLPSVTLAIPARNETEALERSLKAALASNYPKLEIIVLDDCSQDATADIIKSFAHDGVRFIQGGPPPDGHWVHKNYACQQLLEHASGRYILFAGVDVVLAPDTIGQMVSFVTHHKLDMVSIIPGRDRSVGFSLIQTIRYWWELALPRDSLRRPPVLSSCWLANTKSLKAAGGFEAVSRMVVPEAFFAREFDAKQSYRFARGNTGMGVASFKTSKEQALTSMRVRYPQLRRRPEVVMVLTAAWLLQWALPIVYIATSTQFSVYMWLALAGWLAYSSSYVLVSRFYSPSGAVLTAAASPFLPVVDLLLTHTSLYQYEFGQIEWKGRNVCMPVMHVYPSLPKID